MTMYVKNNQLYHISEVRRLHPNTSLPDDGDASSIGYEKLIASAPPAPLPWHTVDQGPPVNNTQTWVQIPMSEEAIIQQVSQRVQQRLDSFAQTRYYDNILSACSYAADLDPRFAAEGRYCLSARSQTWVALSSIMVDVKSGARPMPATYAEIEAELPVLVWPANAVA